MNFERIPVELQALNQWVLWKFEYRDDDPKPTKVPYTINGWRASSTDPRTWATFGGVVSAYQTGEYAGIGFVLSEADPYAFIDLDLADTPEQQQRQQGIYEAFVSYAERSPSGNGLHIITKGRTPRGVKRDKVELYTAQRFMTMTGDVFRDEPINDQSELVDVLFGEMSRGAEILRHDADYPQRDDDQTVIDKAMSAANGEKFKALHEGQWNLHYGDQSAADFAYMDILAFYSQNREQLSRIFLASPLGARDKAKRVFGDGSTYISRMIDRGFDRLLPPIDLDGLRIALEAKLACSPDPASAAEAETGERRGDEPHAVTVQRGEPQSIPWPPGVLGDIADFIYNASPRPVKDIALAGAIGLFAGITGRSYNVSGTGINQYVQLVAETGTGKEAMAEGIARLVEAIVPFLPAAEEFVGPTGISSAPALIKHLDQRSPCFVSLIGESHAFFSKLTSNKASPVDMQLKQLVLDLFNKSGSAGVIRSSIYSDRDKNTKSVKSPAFSILAESEPNQLYSVMDEQMVSSGLLPRFIFIQYVGQRPDFNKQRQTVPNSTLVQNLSTIMAQCFTLQASSQVVNVQLTSEAEAISDSFNRYADDQIRNGESIAKHMWNRAHIKALKLAALVAVGINPYNPIIDLNCINWACEIAYNDALRMIDRFESGEVGAVEGEANQLNLVRRVLKEYVTLSWAYISKYASHEMLHREKIVTASYVNKRLVNLTAFKRDRMGASNAINRALKILTEHDEIREVPKVQLEPFGTTARSYMISGLNFS